MSESRRGGGRISCGLAVPASEEGNDKLQGPIASLFGCRLLPVMPGARPSLLGGCDKEVRRRPGDLQAGQTSGWVLRGPPDQRKRRPDGQIVGSPLRHGQLGEEPSKIGDRAKVHILFDVVVLELLEKFLNLLP